VTGSGDTNPTPDDGFGCDLSKWLICKRGGYWSICRPSVLIGKRVVFESSHDTGSAAFAEFRRLSERLGER
jgi:hypothetical protein